MTVDAILDLNGRLYDSPDGTTYTELTDVIEIGPPDSPKVEVIEVTPLVPNSNAREKLFGLIDYGSMTFRQAWNKTRFSGHKTNLRAKRYWRVVFPDSDVVANASKLEFQGAIVELSKDGFKHGKPSMIDCKVEITGATTFTAGT